MSPLLQDRTIATGTPKEVFERVLELRRLRATIASWLQEKLPSHAPEEKHSPCPLPHWPGVHGNWAPWKIFPMPTVR